MKPTPWHKEHTKGTYLNSAMQMRDQRHALPRHRPIVREEDTSPSPSSMPQYIQKPQYIAWDVIGNRRSEPGWGPYLALASKRHV
jgi:hypothetical protein